MNKAYQRINDGKGWKDYSSDDTPLNAHNLNHMEIGIDEIDNRVIILDETKATKLEISEFFKEVYYDERTGIITFTRKNGATITIDTPMEKIQTGIYYNPDSEKLVLPLIDGTSIEVDLSRIMKFDEFIDSETIAFSVKPNGTVTAIIKEGSIEGKHLRPDYLADIHLEAVEAAEAALFSSESAKRAESFGLMAESYAHGRTGRRPGEDSDNAEYYSNQAKSYYENLQQSGSVTGVKGNMETRYRGGNVNLTPENIGAVNKRGDTIPGNINFSGQGNIWFKTADLTGGHARGLVYENEDRAEVWGGIGAFGTNKVMSGIYIGAGTNIPWDSSQGLFITSTDISWKNAKLVTEGSGVAKEATKSTQDGSGNVITNTYAKRSIYGDTVIGVGRKVMTTVGKCSATLGSNNTASGIYSSALGGSVNTASSNYSAALGGSVNTASGIYSSALGGYSNTASGDSSSVLGGRVNTASGAFSSILGGYNLSSGNQLSVASGHHNAQMATGGSTGNTTGTAFVIGNGTSGSALSNAFSVMFNGVVKAKSTITGSTTADYAEFFEWLDGNPEGEDRVGRFVSLVGNKIAIADSGDSYILGIVSGEPFVLGNGDCDTWNGMFLKDDFNRTIYEPAPKMELDEGTGELVPAVDEDGNLVYEGTRPKLNPKYDPTQPYISRFDRKEWAPVGMLGVLSVIDDGTCIPGQFCKCGTGGIATLAENRGFDTFFVIERKTDNIVSVILK